jgi:hypothetical protein
MTDLVFPECADLLRASIQTCYQATEDYLAMAAGASAWHATEAWLRCELARALQQQFGVSVWLEGRISEIKKYGNFTLLSFEGHRQSGLVDLCIFPRADDPDDAPLRAIVEVKKVTSSGAFDADAQRIRDLQRMLKDPCSGIVCGLVTTKKQSQITDLRTEIARSLDLAEASIHIQGFKKQDHSGRYYGVIGCIV